MDGSLSCSRALEFGGYRRAGGWPYVGQTDLCIGQMLSKAVTWGLAGRSHMFLKGPPEAYWHRARARPRATWPATGNSSPATGNHKEAY